MSSPTSPQANNSPSAAGTGQSTSNDPDSNTNTSPGGQSNGSTIALVPASNSPTSSAQQSQGGGRAGQTDITCYAYCFDRGNGQYTRLIPADMLPPLVDIPALQQGFLGMTVLPCPTGLAPNGRSSNLERVFVQVSCAWSDRKVRVPLTRVMFSRPSNFLLRRSELVTCVIPCK